MARSRLLKPDFFEDEKITSMPFGARCLYAALWCLADREGRLEDRPTRIAAFAFPPMGNERLQASARRDVPAWLELLVGVGMLEQYKVDNEAYLLIKHFSDHQKIHPNEPKSILPPPMVTNGYQRIPIVTNVAGSGSGSGSGSGNKAEAESMPAPAPSHPFALAYVQHWQQSHAGDRCSPIRHGEMVALEKEHGSDRCLQAAEERGWDKPAKYYREWLLDPNNTKEARSNGRVQTIGRNVGRGAGSASTADDVTRAWQLEAARKS